MALKAAAPIMSYRKALFWLVRELKREGLLLNGRRVPAHMRRAVLSHARMLSRPAPYLYEE